MDLDLDVLLFSPWGTTAPYCPAGCEPEAVLRVGDNSDPEPWLCVRCDDRFADPRPEGDGW